MRDDGRVVEARRARERSERHVPLALVDDRIAARDRPAVARPAVVRRRAIAAVVIGRRRRRVPHRRARRVTREPHLHRAGPLALASRVEPRRRGAVRTAREGVVAAARRVVRVARRTHSEHARPQHDAQPRTALRSRGGARSIEARDGDSCRRWSSPAPAPRLAHGHGALRASAGATAERLSFRSTKTFAPGGQMQQAPRKGADQSPIIIIIARMSVTRGDEVRGMLFVVFEVRSFEILEILLRRCCCFCVSEEGQCLSHCSANVYCLPCAAWRVQRRGSLDELPQPASSIYKSK